MLIKISSKLLKIECIIIVMLSMHSSYIFRPTQLMRQCPELLF